MKIAVAAFDQSKRAKCHKTCQAFPQLDKIRTVFSNTAVLVYCSASATIQKPLTTVHGTSGFINLSCLKSNDPVSYSTAPVRKCEEFFCSSHAIKSPQGSE